MSNGYVKVIVDKKTHHKPENSAEHVENSSRYMIKLNVNVQNLI